MIERRPVRHWGEGRGPANAHPKAYRNGAAWSEPFRVEPIRREAAARGRSRASFMTCTASSKEAASPCAMLGLVPGDGHEAIEADIDHLAQQVESDEPRWNDLWASVRAITEAFRTAHFESHGQRQASWERFQGVVARLKERRNEERERASEHLAESARVLALLANAVADGSKNVVQLLGTARSELKAARGAPKEQLDAAWNELKTLEAEWKAEQAGAARELDERIEGLATLFDSARFGDGAWGEVWAEVRGIRDAFKAVRYESREDREEAWSDYQRLVDQIKADRDERQYRSERLAREIRNTAPNLADGGIVGGLASLGASMMTGGFLDSDAEESLKYQSGQLSEAWSRFKEHKDDLLPQERNAVYAELKEAQEILDAAWAELKSAKQAAWRERTEANLNKNRDKLAELLEKEARMSERASKLQDDIDSAWSDDFRERAEGWLEDLEGKLASLREHIARVEGWIEEDEEKLSR